ncbi:MAG: arsenic efflux protein [Bacteroidetes bacterium]|nr:arsenic efflux protein [Bacteroidota bacterium]
MIEVFFQNFKHAITITAFVLMMMLIIEYVNVQSKGTWTKQFQKSTWLQIIFAALMGITPGCLGAFTIVALYTHNILNFAALVTVMIATSGDEAFVMFSTMPKYALKLTLIIFIISIIVGFIVNFFVKNKKIEKSDFEFKIHKHVEICGCYQPKNIIPQLKNITRQRAIFISGFFLFFIALSFGIIGPEKWNWIKYIFFFGGLATIFIVLTVPDHFIKEHLWGHVIKDHLLTIFLWVFGALIFIHFLESYFDITDWLQSNQLIILFIAVLVGIIPESGPHMVFITLFINGTIPFSVLMASSIVQDGHGMLPLFAESKKSFVWVKIINIIVGLIVGLSGYFFNW